MTEPARPRDGDLLASLRALAVTSLAEAIIEAERAVADDTASADLTYLLAELYGRAGRGADSLPLIDRARTLFQGAGRPWEAERCEIGRVAILDDLGRHDEAIEVASHQIARLEASDSRHQADDLLVRVRSNRGLCFETMGRYREAIEDHEAALDLAARLGDEMILAQLHINRSNVLTLLGRSDAAIDGLASAVAVLDAQGSRQDRSKLAMNIGTIHTRRGEYDEALSWFRTAEDLVEPLTEDHCELQIEAGDALHALGALDQALARYRSALDLLAATPVSWLEGRALLGAGVTAGQLGDHATARRHLDAARASFDRAGNRPWSTWSTLELAALDGDHDNGSGRRSDAIDRLATLADTGAWPVQAALCHLRLADLIATAGPDGYRRAEHHLREALRIAESVGMKPLSYRVCHRLGLHLLNDGRIDDAAPHLERAVALVESMRGGLGHLGLLRSFPVTTASVFDALVELRLAQDDIVGAWDAADGARSRSLLDVATGRVGPTSVAAASSELHAIYDQLLNPDRALDQEARAALEARAQALEHELDTADVTFAPSPIAFGREPGAGPDPNPEPDHTSVMFHADRHGTVGVFVASSSGVEFVPAVATVEEVTRLLAVFHTGGRRAYALTAAGREIPASMVAGARAQMAALGEMLLGPVRPVLYGSDDPLTIVPAGILHAVPFAALEVDGTTMVEHRAVVTVPSARIARQLARRWPAGDAVVAVGVTDIGLSGVAAELNAVREAWPRARLLVNHQATRAATATAAQGARLLHLASHGTFRSSHALSSGIRLTDGWLSARDVMGINLRGATVVLSACDTGRVTASDGDELLGLQYGFLAAGARNLVISLWAAHDASAVALMGQFHHELSGGATPADALRRAQLGLRDRRPHPWWWAPFQLVGPT